MLLRTAFVPRPQTINATVEQYATFRGPVTFQSSQIAFPSGQLVLRGGLALTGPLSVDGDVTIGAHPASGGRAGAAGRRAARPSLPRRAW